MPRTAVAEAAPASRERILAAAERRFATFGYRRTGIAEIAREAGVSAGTIYRYFESKEDVFRAVVRELHEAWLARAPGTRRPRDRGRAARPPRPGEPRVQPRELPDQLRLPARRGDRLCAAHRRAARA